MKQQYLATLKFSIPIIFSRTGAQILTILNVAMVGQYGADELAIFGLTSSPYFTFILIALCFTTGLPIAFAKNKQSPKANVSKMIVSAIHWILLSLSFLFICYGLAKYFNTEESTKIFFVLLLAAPGFIGVFILSNIIDALGKPGVSAKVTLLAIPINFIINIILLKLYLPAYGAAILCMVGMALTRWIMFLMLSQKLFLFYKPLLSFKDLKQIDILSLFRDFKDDIVFGGPIAVAYGLGSAGTTAMLIYMAGTSNLDVAAFSISTQLLMLGTLVSRGVSSTTIIKVSELLGKNEFKHIHSVVVSALAVAISIIGVSSLVFIIASDVILRSLTSDLNIINTVKESIGILVLMLIIDGVANVLIGALRPLGDRWLPQAILGLSVCAAPIVLSSIANVNFNTVLQFLLAAQFIALLIISLRWQFRNAEHSAKLELT
jgi:Na+-driven multidrug efflux pump